MAVRTPTTEPRWRFVPVRERLDDRHPVVLTIRPDGLIFVRISDRIKTLEALCEIFAEVATEGMNSPLWTHRSARGRLETYMMPTRALEEPVRYHELNGHAIVEVQRDLSVDEAIARLMPVFSDVTNKYWTMRLPDQPHAA